MVLDSTTCLPDFCAFTGERAVIRKLSLSDAPGASPAPTHPCKIRMVSLPRGYDGRVSFYSAPPDAVVLDLWISDEQVRQRILEHCKLDNRALVSVGEIQIVTTLNVPEPLSQSITPSQAT